jgi:hypothetical protein
LFQVASRRSLRSGHLPLHEIGAFALSPALSRSRRSFRTNRTRALIRWSPSSSIAATLRTRAMQPNPAEHEALVAFAQVFSENRPRPGTERTDLPLFAQRPGRFQVGSKLADFRALFRSFPVDVRGSADWSSLRDAHPAEKSSLGPVDPGPVPITLVLCAGSHPYHSEARIPPHRVSEVRDLALLRGSAKPCEEVDGIGPILAGSDATDRGALSKDAAPSSVTGDNHDEVLPQLTGCHWPTPLGRRCRTSRDQCRLRRGSVLNLSSLP